MAQTYVNVDSLYLAHRLGQMNGKPCFVYVETTGYDIEATLSGSLDDEWATIMAQIPDRCYFGPIAEADGKWTTYHGTVAEVEAAYARIASMYTGTRMCGSFTVRKGEAYLAAVAPYVDIACPSHYDSDGTLSALDLAAQANAHAASAGLPLILAQFATIQAEKVEYAVTVADHVNGIAIYFNVREFAVIFPW